MSRHRNGGAEDRAAQTAALAEIQKSLADMGKHVPELHTALEEVVEDNLALSRAVKGVSDSQESLRVDVCRELDRLRTDVTGELLAQTLRLCCRELAPVSNAVERMLASADFTDADMTRQHLQSLATTLEAAMLRLGIERLPIVVGQDQFNSRIHDCVRTCTRDDSPILDARHGAIVFVQEPGYTIGGTIAQPARVWVQQATEAASAGAAEKDTSCDTTK